MQPPRETLALDHKYHANEEAKNQLNQQSLTFSEPRFGGVLFYARACILTVNECLLSAISICNWANRGVDSEFKPSSLNGPMLRQRTGREIGASAVLFQQGQQLIQQSRIDIASLT